METAQRVGPVLRCREPTHESMMKKLYLALFLVVAGGTASPERCQAVSEGTGITILYSADERGEIEPCG